MTTASINNLQTIWVESPHDAGAILAHRSETRIIIKPLKGLHSTHMLLENVVLRLLTLVEFYNIYRISIGASEKMTSI